MNDKLKTFLYLLMRDHLPCGAVVNTVNIVDEIDADDGIVFTNKELGEMAERLAARIIRD